MAQSQRQRVIRWAIVSEVMPAAVERFLRKNEDYGEGSDEFGLKAQVIDISRKYKKIKAAIWDGEELTGEPLIEVCEDMIGHLLLIIEKLKAVEHGGTIELTHSDWANAYEDFCLNFTEDLGHTEVADG